MRASAGSHALPELPEVETVRRGLGPAMEGRVICKVVLHRTDLRWPMPEGFSQRIEGTRVIRLRRLAKFLLADLSSGKTILIHLGMSGRLLLCKSPSDKSPDSPTPQKHDHVVFKMDDGARVVFNDPRRFGSMDLYRSDDESKHWLLRSLGPEPLGNSFNGMYLTRRLAGKKAPIKSALLDQSVIAGLGNIYACEALWNARISPILRAGSLSPLRVERLTAAIKSVLADAIKAGGSSLRDFRQTGGELGYFQHQFQAYGREGKECRRERCFGTISRVSQSGRSTFFCQRCQR